MVDYHGMGMDYNATFDVDGAGDDPFYMTILRHIENRDLNITNGDYRRPIIKSSLRYVFPLFVIIYALLILFATAGNVAILFVIIRRKLHRDPTYFFIGNLALSDILKAAIVVPITLANLLIQNWIFGSFLCYALPMMHSFPIHASMLTYVMIAIDRYRLIVHTMKGRVPAGLGVIAIWVVAVCVVLPYAVYIKYFDLGKLVNEMFNGVGICYVNQERHIEEYLRGMFVCLYCLPLAVIAFLYIWVSRELKNYEEASTCIQVDETLQSMSETSYHSRVTWSTSLSEHRIDPEGASGESTRTRGSFADQKYIHADDNFDDIDIVKEKRTQTYMITMVGAFAICWGPLNILVLVTHFVYENEDNTGHFDITYLTMTFIGFVSTCCNPVLFAFWHMSDQTKARLRGYLRFSNRRRSELGQFEHRRCSRSEFCDRRESIPTRHSGGKEHNKDFV